MSKVLHLFPPQDTFIDHCYELNTTTSIEEFIAFNKVQIRYLRGTWRSYTNTDTFCLECKGIFKEGETALVSFLSIANIAENDFDPISLKPSNTGKIYHHIKCLKCHECNESLSFHGIYFLDESCCKTFCGRHFSQRIKPRCSGCDELIFADEYTRAEGLDWHTHHFLCARCNEPILLVPDQTSYTIMPLNLLDKALAGLPVCKACLNLSSSPNDDHFYGNRNQLTLSKNPSSPTYLNIEQLSSGNDNINRIYNRENGFYKSKLTVPEEILSNSSSSSSIRYKVGRRHSKLKKNCRRARQGNLAKGCSTCSNTTSNSKFTSPNDNDFYQEPYAISAINYYGFSTDNPTLPEKVLLPFGKALNCSQGQDSIYKSVNKAATTRMGRLLKAFTRLKGPRFIKSTSNNRKDPTCQLTMKHLHRYHVSSNSNKGIAPIFDKSHGKGGDEFECSYGILDRSQLLNDFCIDEYGRQKYQLPLVGINFEEENLKNSDDFTNPRSSISPTGIDINASDLLANMTLSCINEADENPDNNYELNFDHSNNLLDCYDAPLLK